MSQSDWALVVLAVIVTGAMAYAFWRRDDDE